MENERNTFGEPLNPTKNTQLKYITQRARDVLDRVDGSIVTRDMGISRSTLHRRLNPPEVQTVFDTHHKGDIICPWCGYVYIDSNDYAPDDLSVPGFDDCPECDKEFKLGIEPHDGYTLYSTYRITHKQEA